MKINQTHPVVRAALDDVNSARKALDLPLLAEVPDGQVAKADGCPMYHALRNGHDMLVLSDLLLVKGEDAATKIGEAWGEIIEDVYDVGMESELLNRNIQPVDWWSVVLPYTIGDFISKFDHGGLNTEEGMLA